MVVLDSSVVDGWTWSVITPATVPSGLTCDELKAPLPAGTFKRNPTPTYSISGSGCLRSSQLFWAGPVNVHVGWLNAGPAAAEHVWGEVSPRVQSLSVQLANCRVVDVPVTHGVFLYVAPDSTPTGTTPVALIAKGSDGTTLKTVPIGQLPTAVAQLPSMKGTPLANGSTSDSSTC
jgi:hypothetical protein